MARIRGLLGAAVVLAVLAGCERPLILSGQRFDVRAPLADSAAAASGEVVADEQAENRSLPSSLPISLGPAVANADWTHLAGSSSHVMGHPALSANPQPLWTVTIGAANARRQRITTAPVVAGGTVYAMDAANQVVAVGANSGALHWQTDVTMPGERPGAVSGGGLAVGEGRLFVTTGFGELLAMDPADGRIIWRQRFEGPVSGAPTVAGGTVYVAGRDGVGWAVNAADGKLRWIQGGVRQSAGMAGGSSPAVGGKRVVMPYSSGQLMALDTAKGELEWISAVAGQRLGRAVAFIAELAGDPVIAGNTVYAGSNSGRTAAFRLDNGDLLWSADEGSMNPVWPVGNAVFLVSDEGQLVRLDAASGETVWTVPLGHWVRERVRRQRDVHAHYGPVLAGGRLVVVSSDGRLRFFAPDSGAELGGLDLAAGATAPMAVAGGTLFVVTAKGQLQAFR